MTYAVYFNQQTGSPQFYHLNNEKQNGVEPIVVFSQPPVGAASTTTVPAASTVPAAPAAPAATAPAQSQQQQPQTTVTVQQAPAFGQLTMCQAVDPGDATGGLPQFNNLGSICGGTPQLPGGPIQVPAAQAPAVQQQEVKGVTAAQKAQIDKLRTVYTDVVFKNDPNNAAVIIGVNSAGKTVITVDDKGNVKIESVPQDAPKADDSKKPEENKAVAATNEPKKPEEAKKDEPKPNEAQQAAIDRLTKENGGHLAFEFDSNNKGNLISRETIKETGTEKTFTIHPDGTCVEITKNASREGFWGWLNAPLNDHDTYKARITKADGTVVKELSDRDLGTLNGNIAKEVNPGSQFTI